MDGLKNKIIVVTGGCGLLGASLVKDLNRYKSLCINLDIGVTDDLDSGTLYCDITNSKSVKASIEKILKKYKKIDGWVNNAYPRTKDWGNRFENVSLESWKQNLDMQLGSVFNCCKLVLGVMSNQKNGSIVNISSIYGMGAPDFSVYDNTLMTMPVAYSAIKGGLINFSKYLASYYGKDNIRINCVSPGGIFNNQEPIFVSNFNKKVPLGRMADAKDVSPGVCFLLSDEASYITGHNLVVDGGWTCI